MTEKRFPNGMTLDEAVDYMWDQMDKIAKEQFGDKPRDNRVPDINHLLKKHLRETMADQLDKME